jgi:hypothetical protein
MQRLFLLETPMIRCDKLRCQLSSCGQVENCHPASDVDQVNLGTDGTGKPRIPCSLLIWQCEGNHAFICIKDFPTTYTENLWMFHCLAPYVTLGLEWIRWVSLGITMYHWHLNCLSLSASRSKKKNSCLLTRDASWPGPSCAWGSEMWSPLRLICLTSL